MNVEMTCFAGIFILAFFAGMSNDRIAGEPAYRTVNYWDTTVLKVIDVFFSSPRDSRPMFSVLTSLVVNWLW